MSALSIHSNIILVTPFLPVYMKRHYADPQEDFMHRCFVDFTACTLQDFHTVGFYVMVEINVKCTTLREQKQGAIDSIPYVVITSALETCRAALDAEVCEVLQVLAHAYLCTQECRAMVFSLVVKNVAEHYIVTFQLLN